MRDQDSDQEYNEAEDEDYNPAAPNSDAASSSEDETETTADKTRKRKSIAGAGREVEELDSGDEATIRERQLQKRRKIDDEPADDSFIRTRAQRLAEKIEAKSRNRATAGRVTVDVDSLWAELNSIPVGLPPPALKSTRSLSNEEDAGGNVTAPSETITITRRVKFAGAVTEINEDVSRHSKEAQDWLAEQEKDAQKEVDTELQASSRLSRPLRRISRFEPNPLGMVRGVPPEKLRRKLPSRVDLIMAERRQEGERAKRAEKLSTMQKTQLDWKGFVIEQGLGEELKEYGKSKKGYIAREAFLDRVHGVNETARRTARLKS